MQRLWGLMVSSCKDYYVRYGWPGVAVLPQGHLALLSCTGSKLDRARCSDSGDWRVFAGDDKHAIAIGVSSSLLGLESYGAPRSLLAMAMASIFETSNYCNAKSCNSRNSWYS